MTLWTPLPVNLGLDMTMMMIVTLRPPWVQDLFSCLINKVQKINEPFKRYVHTQWLKGYQFDKKNSDDDSDTIFCWELSFSLTKINDNDSDAETTLGSGPFFLFNKCIGPNNLALSSLHCHIRFWIIIDYDVYWHFFVSNMCLAYVLSL